MGARWQFASRFLTVAGLLAGSVAAVACAAQPADEVVGGDRSSVTQSEFDKNMLVSDTAMRDSTAMTTEDIQAFLDKTPWNKKSVLATYEEGGKSAAEIMHDAAEKYGINPLELLVRVQMEQGLINKTTASEESISIAFGCGCPHSPVCSSKYEGFANQADCAAGTLRRSMDKAVTTNGTVSGWKRGAEKLTQDKVEVVPQNAATAALYTYTPYVGEAGGGQKGVGGASLHNAVWDRFAESISYGVTAPTGTTGSNTTRSADAGAANNEPAPAPQGSSGSNTNNDPGADAGGTPTEEPGTADAGASGSNGSTSADAGTKKKGDTSEGTDPSTGNGNDDGDILGEGNAPPANNAPPPKSSSSKSKSKGSEEEATEEELSGKKKASDSGGCSSSGSHASGSDAALAALVLTLGSVIARRRRQEHGVNDI